jgi:protein PhnA
MSKGYDQNQQRHRALTLFGKDLTRRCRSKCELCEVAGEALSVFEFPPAPAEPEFPRCLFLCDRCREELGGATIALPERWRCLNNTVWSEIPVVQASAVTLLRRLASDHPWAKELLDQVFLEPDTQTLLGEG